MGGIALPPDLPQLHVILRTNKNAVILSKVWPLRGQTSRRTCGCSCFWPSSIPAQEWVPPGLCSWRPGIPQKQTRHPDRSRFSGGGKYLLSLFSPSNPSSVPLRKSIVLSYRLDHSESLHKINPICALLIIGRRKSHGPNLFLDSGRGRFGEGTGPLPHPPCTRNCANQDYSDRERRRILVSPSLVPLSLCPSEQGCEAAQFCNEDRIKIFPKTVQSSATCTNKVTSETVQHRITSTKS
jgi:hypothetical protein